MSDPFKIEENTLPVPDAEFSGLQRKDGFGKRAFAAVAKLWRPRGTSMEPAAATVSRYAMRLIDRKTGKAYAADEMPAALVDPLVAQWAGSGTQAAALRTALGIVPRRKYLHGTGAAFTASRLKLDAGEDAAFLFLGDSTYRNNASGVYHFANLLSAQYPYHRVELARADNNMQGYTTTLVSSGFEGPRYRYFPVGALRNLVMPASMATDTPNATNLISIECVFALDAGQISAGKPTAQYRFGGFLSGGTVPTQLLLTTDGKLEFNHRNAANGSPSNWQSSVAVAGGNMVAGTRYGVKVTYQPSNGSGSSIVNYYTSTDDGVTWNQLGSANQATTASDIGVTTGLYYFLGHHGAAPSGGIKIYSFNIKIGTAQKKLLPDRIDLWVHSAGQTTGTTVLGGSPTIYIDQAAQDGATIASGGFFSGSGAGDFPIEFYRAIPNHHYDWISLASSHNDGDTILSQEDWNDAMDDAVTAILGVFQNDPVIVHSTQNPEPLDYAEGGLSYQHNRRQKDIIEYAGRRGRDCTDPYQAFVDADNPAHSIPGDVHPAAPGYSLWGRAFLDAFLVGTNGVVNGLP